MKFTQEKTENGVTERFFEISVAGDDVPGVLWTPDCARGPRPLLLMGHGGSQHKMFPPFAAYARRYAREFNYAVVAIDAPGHGARATPDEVARSSEKMRQQISLGGGVGGEMLQRMLQSSMQAVPEWRAVLDTVTSLEFVGLDGAVGYLGLSMGGMTGSLLVASDPRIKAAVLGLVGLQEETELLAEAVRKLNVPVEFLMQWDDELISRGAAMAFFDAIGSSEKTLHANPGGHGGVPIFERTGWIEFFTRHFGKADLYS